MQNSNTKNNTMRTVLKKCYASCKHLRVKKVLFSDHKSLTHLGKLTQALVYIGNFQNNKTRKFHCGTS